MRLNEDAGYGRASKMTWRLTLKMIMAADFDGNLRVGKWGRDIGSARRVVGWLRGY
jgi:hypothetical protein